MAQLTIGMYGDAYQRTSNLFGLRCGQIRYEGRRTHDAGWYNKAGEKIGWGDLSNHDMTQIASELATDELFIVLGVGDTYMDNVVPENYPSIDYVASCATFIVAPGHCYVINDWEHTPKKTTYLGVMQYEVLTREQAVKLIKDGVLPA